MTLPRRKRRQAQRRLKRTAMQNHMTVCGWVPIKYKGQFGIYNLWSNQLVLRRWYVGLTGITPQPTATSITTSPAGGPPRAGAWRYQCSAPLQPFEGYTEIAWIDIQLRWVHALRATAIQRGWM